MTWVRTIKADENLNKKYRIEVYYDNNADYLWEDIQFPLEENNIEIFSNLSRYSLAENEQKYNGDPEELKEEGYDLRPIYAYIHSGIVLSLGRDGQFSDQFDSGLAGFAAVQGKFTPEQEKALETYIKNYNSISNSEVYGYRIVTNDGNNTIVDDCGGFIDNGDDLAKYIFENINPQYGITLEEIKEEMELPRER